MNELKRVEKLKEKLNEAEKEKIRIETKISTVKSELKRMGINNLAEGKSRIKKIKEKLEIMKKKRDEMLKGLEKKLEENDLM